MDSNEVLYKCSHCSLVYAKTEDVRRLVLNMHLNSSGFFEKNGRNGPLMHDITESSVHHRFRLNKHFAMSCNVDRGENLQKRGEKLHFCFKFDKIHRCFCPSFLCEKTAPLYESERKCSCQEAVTEKRK